MNFKEQINNDLNIFFNSDEFTEDHKIDGKTVGIIIDNDELKKRTEEFGVFDADILYYAKTNDFIKPVLVGAIQKFDNKICQVVDVKENSGVLEILLKRNGDR